jgi:hypothetical protein
MAVENFKNNNSSKKINNAVFSDEKYNFCGTIFFSTNSKRRINQNCYKDVNFFQK